MRRTLLLLLGLASICAIMLLGRHYFDAHPILLGIIATVIVVVGNVIYRWPESGFKKPPVSEAGADRKSPPVP